MEERLRKFRGQCQRYEREEENCGLGEGGKCVKRERENGVSCLCICEEDMLREQDSRVVQNIHYTRIGSDIIILYLLCLGEKDARYIYIYIYIYFTTIFQYEKVERRICT